MLGMSTSGPVIMFGGSGGLTYGSNGQVYLSSGNGMAFGSDGSVVMGMPLSCSSDDDSYQSRRRPAQPQPVRPRHHDPPRAPTPDPVKTLIPDAVVSDLVVLYKISKQYPRRVKLYKVMCYAATLTYMYEIDWEKYKHDSIPASLCKAMRYGERAGIRTRSASMVQMRIESNCRLFYTIRQTFLDSSGNVIQNVVIDINNSGVLLTYFNVLDYIHQDSEFDQEMRSCVDADLDAACCCTIQ